MRDQRYTLTFARSCQSASQQKIPGYAQVVRPDDAVLFRRAIEQSMNGSVNSRKESGRGRALLGNVSERSLNEQFNRDGGEQSSECFVPISIQGLSAGENNGVHLCRSTQVGRGQLNDAPNAAGAQMIVNDDEFQSLVIS